MMSRVSALALSLTATLAACGPQVPQDEDPRAPEASAQSPLISGAGNWIMARHSSLFLAVEGGSAAVGARIVQTPLAVGATPPSFTLNAATGGAYRVVAQASGQCVEVRGANLASGADVVQGTCNGSGNQLFAPQSAGGGYVTLVAQHSGKCLTVTGAAMTAGAALSQQDCTGADSQRFMLPVGAAQAPLPQALKDFIVRAHNDSRASLGATAMQTMVWDDELANFAGQLASNCVFAHSTLTQRRNVPGWVGITVGENLAVANSYAASPSDQYDPARLQSFLQSAMNSWWSERVNYSYASNTCATGQTCGHFTQMAWASSNRIGCAVARCNPLQGLPVGPVHFLSCNYGPAGNLAGQRPYVLPL